MDPKPPPKITTAGLPYHPRATSLIAKTFTTDPLLRFMLSSLSDEARLAYLPKYISAILKAAALNDASFVEADDFSCCGVWMPPGKRVDNPFTLFQAGLLGALWEGGWGAVKRSLWDYTTAANAAKTLGLLSPTTGKPLKTQYHYLFFIATDFPARGQGLASAIERRHQQVAAQDGLPLWLEATTEHSRDIYARLGFKVVQEMVLGRGTHGASGAMEAGGSGVRVWGMVWWPPGLREGS